MDTRIRARYFFLRLRLRRPGSHVAYACAYACSRSKPALSPGGTAFMQPAPAKGLCSFRTDGLHVVAAVGAFSGVELLQDNGEAVHVSLLCSAGRVIRLAQNFWRSPKQIWNAAQKNGWLQSKGG